MTDAMLKEYLSQAAIQDFREIMDTPYAGEAEGNSLFYRHQQKKMLKDPCKWYRERRKPVWKRMAQRAACFFLILLLGLGSAMAVSPTVRAAVVNFIKEVFQDQVIYRFTGEAQYSDQRTDILPDYEITGLPDGYVVEDILYGGNVNKTIIYNLPDAEDWHAAVTLYYGFMEDGSLLAVEGEGLLCTPVKKGSFRGEFYESTVNPEESAGLVWQDTQQNIMFSIGAKGSVEDLVALAMSVKKQ